MTNRFLENNQLDYVVRSHEVKEAGYELNHDGKCITVFSAPNYCDTMGNKGAFINLWGTGTGPKGLTEPKFTSYESEPHPNVRPILNVF